MTSNMFQDEINIEQIAEIMVIARFYELLDAASLSGAAALSYASEQEYLNPR